MKSYVAYIRVSTVKQGEHGSSLQEQRAAIEAYAARHNLSIAEWYEEIETAAKQGRQLFNRMLTEVARKHSAGVIIHKIDRSARNLKDWARLGELIDRGLEIHFAHESLDLATRGGRLAADIQAVVAADFIRNLREETRKGFYGRLKQGFYPLAAPRGYLDCGRGKAKAIDPIEAPLIREAFGLYATGDYGLDTLRLEMQRRGLRTRRGAMLSRRGMANILHNTFYVGIIRLRKTEEVFEGNHTPLITTELFDKVHAVLAGRVFARQPSDPFLFRRLVRCAVCGLSLIGERQKGHVYYRCHSRSCRGTSMRGDAIDECVTENLDRLRFAESDLGEIRDLVDKLIDEERSDEAQRVERVARDLALIDERMHRLTDLLLDGTIDRDTYQERKKALLWRKRELEEIRSRDSHLSFWSGIRADIERANAASNLFQMADPDEKREILKSLTSNLVAREKELVFPMRSPFAEVRQWAILNECDPDRPHPRNDDTPKAARAPAIKSLMATFAQMNPKVHDNGNESQLPPGRGSNRAVHAKRHPQRTGSSTCEPEGLSQSDDPHRRAA